MNKAGYEYLLAYKITVPIYDYTVEFCKRWVDYKSRTKDQMEQAARSGMQNIPEGNKQQSLSSYIKLAGVARGSIEELLNDYLAYARQNKIAIWDKDRVRREIKERDEIWEILNLPTLPSSPAFPSLPLNSEIAVNLLVDLLKQAGYLQDRLISSLKEKHAREGGFSENLLKKRLSYRKSSLFFLLSLLPLLSLLFPSPASAANSGQFTMSLWVNPSTSVASKALVGKAEEFRIFTNASGFVGCQIKTTSWQTASQATTKALVVGQWSSVICTYDLVNLKVYVNGVLTGSTALTTIADDTTAVLLLGQDSSSGTTYTNLAGVIDEFKFYNYSLTLDEIRTDYNRGSALILGNLSTTSTGVATSSAGGAYCPPGDTATCNPPVAEWNFEEGTGTSVSDNSGNANTGTWSGGSTSRYTPGKIGKAGKFNGTDDYVDAGNGTSLNLTSKLTYSVWYKRENSAGYPSTISKGSYQDSWDLSPGNLRIGGFSVEDHVFSGDTNNVWHNIVFTYDNSLTSNNLNIYLDGILVGTWADTHSFRVTSSSVTIGKLVGSLTYFKGSIDQVRIFNYARSPAQIAWDYNQGKPVGHWKFDECSGANAKDSSGNSNTGTITIGASGTQTSVGTCTTSAASSRYNGASGKFNASLNFDGTDDYIDMGDVNTVEGIGTLTVSAWIYPTTNNVRGMIVSKDLLGQRSWYLSKSESSADNKITFAIGDATAGGINSTSTVTTNAWNHVVAIYNKNGTTSTDRLKIYINGILASGAVATDRTTDLPSTTAKLQIGAREYVGSTQNFSGRLDDVRVYNYALTATQIKTLFNEGSSVRFGQ